MPHSPAPGGASTSRRAAALLAGGLLATLAGCSGVVPGPGSTISDAEGAGTDGSVTGVASAPSPPPAEDALGTAAPVPPVELIDYTAITGLPDGVIIRTPDSVDALSGAPQDFHDYLAGRIAAADVLECSLTIGVQKVRTDGYAVGTLRGCDDLHVVWARQEGVWTEVASGRQGFGCSALETHGVPAVIAGPQCLDGTSFVPFGPQASQPSPRVEPRAEGGQRYINVRYGFSCVLPEGWSLEEAANADGVTATDPTGRATASCLGRNSLADGTLVGEYSAARAALLGAGVDITYEHVADSTFILSGTRPDGSIAYQWFAVGQASANGVAWSYPGDMKEDLDAAVTTSVTEFARGDLARAG